MVNKIIDGIVAAIYDAFGDQYEIITEDLKQGLKAPCFSVSCLTSSTVRTIGERYRSRNLFCVYYFPSSEYDQKKECFGMMTKLIPILEDIRVDGNLVRGINFNAEVRDNVLVCLVNYNLSLMREQEKLPKMDKIQANSEVNNG